MDLDGEFNDFSDLGLNLIDDFCDFRDFGSNFVVIFVISVIWGFIARGRNLKIKRATE